MSVNVTASSSTITATADGTAVQAGVSSSTVSASSSGGIGPQGPQGPPGTADLPEGTEGQVLTYVGGQWTAAAPANPFDQSLNIGENVEFGSVLLPNGTQITEGSFDNGTGGQNGISIHCYLGYELNWQGGRLRSTSDGGTTTAQIWFDSPIEFQGEGGSVYIDATGITFPDQTSQTTAWTGSVSAGDVSGLAAVATSGDYADLSNAPGQYVLPAANTTTLGGIIVGTGLSFFANGSVSVAYGTSSTTACRGDDSRLSNARTPTSHVHGNLTNAGAIGSTSGQIVVTTTAGVLTTAASISLSQISQSSATTGQVVAWNGTAWAPATAASSAVTSVAGRTGAVTLTTSDVSGLGTLATQSGTFSGTSSGTNTGDQTITLTGDVTGSGTGSFAATLASSGVSAGTYTSVTVNSKGLVTAGSSPVVAYSALSGVPSTFTPPIATASVLGGVRQGSNVTIAADGTISVAAPVTSLPYASITGTPTLAAVATSGSASDISAGTLSASRLPTSGVSAGTYTSVTVDTYGRVTAGSSPAVAYSSLSGVPSTFAPSAHASSHASGGLDQISIAASQITGGTIATARLASGSASATTYLRGDQTWATVSGGSATTSASDLTSGILDDQRLSAKSQAAMNLYLWSNFR